MNIDVTQPVTDLRGNAIPLGGAEGHLSRILGSAVTVPGDSDAKESTTVRDVLETVLVLTPPDQTNQAADDKRKAYKLAQRISRTDNVELSHDEAELVQRRGAQYLPVIEFGFLDDVIETARAQAVLAEKNAAESASSDENRGDEPGGG